MRKIDRRIVIIITLIFTIGLAYGVMRYLISLKEAPPVRKVAEVKRLVKVESVAYSDLISPVEEFGRLSSVSEVDMVAEASGKILAGRVSLKKGTRFNRGDTLFIVYQEEAALALKARKSQFMNLLANILPDLKIDYPDQSAQFYTFFGKINVDSPLPEFPVISAEKLKIFLASRGILSEYYNIIKDELQLNRYVVRAPFKGTFTQVTLEVGAYTGAGGKVARVIRTDQMELEVPLERFDAEWVKIGDQVVVHSDRRDLTWQGRVIRKGQFVDPGTQTQLVFVEIPNGSGSELLAGEYLRAEFKGHPIQQVMEIPRNAVFNTNEVFVIREGRLERELLNVIKENKSTLIFNGLDVGEIIVVQPLINVQEGVQVDWEGNPDRGKEKPGGNPQGPPSQQQADKSEKKNKRG